MFNDSKEILARLAKLEADVKRLKQKMHDANIEELHEKTGVRSNTQY